MSSRQRKFLVKPLFSQVRDELASRIAGGTWKTGALLPNEIELAIELGVSQGTIRKALDLLESEKLVVRRQGRGTFVIDHDTDEMAVRFSCLFNARGQRVAGHVAECVLQVEAGTDVETRELGLADGEQIVRLKRVREYNDRPFMFEIARLPYRSFRTESEPNLKSMRLTCLAQRSGVQLSHAAEEVASVPCPAEVSAKLNCDTEYPVLKLSRRTYSLRGDRVECREAWCYLKEKTYISISR